MHHRPSTPARSGVPRSSAFTPYRMGTPTFSMGNLRPSQTPGIPLTPALARDLDPEEDMDLEESSSV